MRYGFVWLFLHDLIESKHFLSRILGDVFLLHHIRKYTMSVCLIIGDANLTPV